MEDSLHLAIMKRQSISPLIHNRESERKDIPKEKIEIMYYPSAIYPVLYTPLCKPGHSRAYH